VQQLIHFCSDQLKIQLSERQINAFNLYQDELIHWNQKFNLTSITDPAEIEIKHFIDSLTCIMVLNRTHAMKIIDIGTGAGFPGIPIKIVLPDFDLTLVESNQKKAEYCKHLLDLLEMSRSTVICGRIEEIAQDQNFREKFGAAIARAVASLPTLMEYLLPCLRPGGIGIAMKGKNIKQELDSAKKAIEILGGEIKEIVNFTLPIFNEERNLIVIRKINPTPSKYPRRSGIPSKKPLN
jgi:16S rRNA (guanine527-N7)-methyltransferase